MRTIRRIKLLLRTFLSCAFVLHVGPLIAQNATFVLETESLHPYTPTFVGNGHFSVESTLSGTRPSQSYMAWVYDHGDGDVPRIAALPAWNEVNFFNGEDWLNDIDFDEKEIRSYHQKLIMEDGLLETSYVWADDDRTTRFEIQTFISRSSQNIAVIRFTVIPSYSGRVTVSFPLQAREQPHRMRLEELREVRPDAPGSWPFVWYPGWMAAKKHTASPTHEGGRISVLAQSEGRPVTVAVSVDVVSPSNLRGMSSTPSEVRGGGAIQITFDASAEERYNFYKYVAAVSSHEAAEPLEYADRSVETARARGYSRLLEEHEEAWHQLWESDIIVEGNPELQRLIHSTLFYLLCSAREGTDFSVPPMGLSTSGYYGHIFWDADTFIFPSLLLLHPEIAKSIVMFRYRALERARSNARLNDYGGAKYPWESDELGAETTPMFAYQNALNEVHVTGDVALAQWQYYLATGDLDWLERYGYPVIKETADFWLSRVSFDCDRDRYEIQNVVSVDEGLIGIRNDTYTNAVAAKNLKIAIAAAELCGKEKDEAWENVSRKLSIPYDERHAYHPTYEGAPPSSLGAVVPLLDYPLEIPMTDEAKRNDLLNAVRRMRAEGSGAMMGVAFYSIIAAELNDQAMLDSLHTSAAEAYLRPPFNVLAETPTNNSTNFLTGAGAFLQQFIFGYTGMRLSADGLARRFKPMLPSGIRKLVLKNIHVRDKTFDAVVENGQLELLDKKGR